MRNLAVAYISAEITEPKESVLTRFTVGSWMKPADIKDWSYHWDGDSPDPCAHPIHTCVTIKPINIWWCQKPRDTLILSTKELFETAMSFDKVALLIEQIFYFVPMRLYRYKLVERFEGRGTSWTPVEFASSALWFGKLQDIKLTRQVHALIFFFYLSRVWKKKKVLYFDIFSPIFIVILKNGDTLVPWPEMVSWKFI